MSLWNAEDWLKRFHTPSINPDHYRSLRREVWKSTTSIVERNSYVLPDGRFVTLRSNQTSRSSSFYKNSFTASFEPLDTSPEITVVQRDCLDAAHDWVKQGLSVSVLNLASRQNPGGGVVEGSGAQEEYLFRCSDYYKFLYRYADYAEKYGLKRSRNQYPMDRNFGGIYSSGVTIFRENEETGYKLASHSWKVNMIAVAGINTPKLIIENGQQRISPELVEGAKNKIRTIFRIACDNGQRNLVLGALGCGAFHNPPEHMAELFKEVINEDEFKGAFLRICFAIKKNNHSPNSENYLAFSKVFTQNNM